MENAQLAKVLADRDYWLALNEISGENLTVFSIHTKERKRVRARSDNSKANYMEMLVSVSSYENPSKSTDTLIGKFFGEDVKISYPALLFFQVNDEKITDALVVCLKEKFIEKSFEEIKKYITAASITLKKIKPEYQGNYSEIFDQLELSVKGVEQLYTLKRYLNVANSVFSFVEIIKMFF
ncbi:hypothetical protein PQ469_19330 [Mucilaginibacter sp. KACC 22773]|uniref:hypothetical protein n=1 Tax=Mucilaginibacter sp. KACC 22773 TaxID=3025671 RepID=UPI0023656C5C|nr:hypothetical protein [Mucilaginibacter sp. KACC 22773]WDF76046.1 hypothetical protein PQ469_19330 [Mucilaginibacter sp. KACC 22773]